ncbi:MAG: DNA replication and repair protein RecF [Candidatus Thiodiazotropha sp. (ex Rostrolucina anterorostrata)]|nr:DNA replication and repair protein RecF [Candidatus Thiodiazotropha sp. (ex Rostrolucina anterorostrata)]
MLEITLQINFLSIENLRNVINAELEPSSSINLITGKNGAGKTTILESIYLLARARSFRQSQNINLIRKDAELLNIFTKIQNSNGIKHKIGLQKKRRTTQVRKDGGKITRLSELAKSLPITVITPNIQRIIEDEPKHRRRLLNWGMFHVEHDFGNLVNRYKKALNQRNNALRKSEKQIIVWDKQVATLGSEINQKMVNYVNEWNTALSIIINHTGIIKPIRLEVRSGWRDGLSLFEAINANKIIDIQRGFTSCGPHRSDLRILEGSELLKNRLSRGQMKLTAILMILGQAAIQSNNTGELPILLGDDLHSELDVDSYQSLLNMISEIGMQSFITALDDREEQKIIERCRGKLFHVEHGSVATA